MSTIEIFPTKIYKVKYSGNTAELYESIKSKLQEAHSGNNNQVSMRGDGYCSYNTARNLHKWPELQSLVAFLSAHAQSYWDSLGYDSNARPGVYEMWSNVYNTDSYIESHNHSPIHMTASFYLKMPKDGGNLVFEHPNSTLLKHQPYGFDNIRYGANFEYEIPVEEGDVVFFPGYLNHKTKPNKSNEPRIILGSNVCNVS